ncbi:metallophosphoesterase [Haloferax sp. S1W]|uniref:metallophosphoesterase n=1 Tax=Haloferax sp. S1W TaxID=3377110 RepID=UPI0037C93EF8
MLSLAVRDRAIYLPTADALVLSDLHVGRAEAPDVSYPLGERTDLSQRLAALCEEFDPREVVFAGDVLHRFDRVSDRAVETVELLAETCRDAGSRPVFVAGNHDTMLAEVWSSDDHDEKQSANLHDEKQSADLHHEYRLDDNSLISHGHRHPDGSSHLHVVGHDHPTLTIDGRTRPCVLYGPEAYRGADVLMLPAFTRLAGGVEVNQMRAADFQSPMVQDVGAFRPLVRDEEAGETLTFPPLEKLRRLL